MITPKLSRPIQHSPFGAGRRIFYNYYNGSTVKSLLLWGNYGFGHGIRGSSAPRPSAVRCRRASACARFITPFLFYRLARLSGFVFVLLRLPAMETVSITLYLSSADAITVCQERKFAMDDDISGIMFPVTVPGE